MVGGERLDLVPVSVGPVTAMRFAPAWDPVISRFFFFFLVFFLGFVFGVVFLVLFWGFVM